MRKPGLTRIELLVVIAIMMAAMTSCCSAEDVVVDKGRRPLLGVQRWDMYSGKGATQRQELGYLPGKQGFLKDPQWHKRAPFFCRLATEDLINTYESKFLNRGLPFIPPCTSMQYPWPRALDKETGVPTDRWYHYQWPQQGDLAARVKAAFDFVATHPKACEAQVVTMCSWNEHSEGGGLCPTMGTPPEYRPVTTWLDEVAGALAAWQYPMDMIQEN